MLRGIIRWNNSYNEGKNNLMNRESFSCKNMNFVKDCVNLYYVNINAQQVYTQFCVSLYFCQWKCSHMYPINHVYN